MKSNQIVFRILQDVLRTKYNVEKVELHTYLFSIIDKVDYVNLLFEMKDRLYIDYFVTDINELAEPLFNDITIEDLVILLQRSVKQKETV